MQQTRDLTDRQAYYKLKGIAQRVVKDAKKQHWRDYCNTLDKTSKFGKVLEDDQEDERRRDEKIDTDTQAGRLGVRQQPDQGRIVRKEVRQRKFKHQPLGRVPNPMSDDRTATQPAGCAIWRIELNNYRRRRNQHSV